MNRISPPALKRLQVLYSQANARFDLGNSREERLAWATQCLGRPVTSFSALTVSEGKTCIDALQASLGIAETAKPRRGYASKREAQKAGTEGRNDQIHAETTLLDGTENIFTHIRREMDELGMDEERLRSFLRSKLGPEQGRDTIRTLGDANRVHFALKNMAARRRSRKEEAA